jgi:hypothetical protein
MSVATLLCRVCEYCKKEFSIPLKRFNQGGGKFCSPSCRNKSRFKLNPDGVNTGNPLENTVCPVSLEKLRDLYWKQGMSTIEIASSLSDFFGSSFAGESVRRWLVVASIEIRSKKHAMHVVNKKYPELKVKRSKIMKRRYADGCAPIGNKGFSKKIRNKANKVRIKMYEDRRIIRICAFPGCSKSVIRPLCTAKDLMYCCRSHSNKHRGILKREAIEKSLLEAQAEEVFGRSFA